MAVFARVVVACAVLLILAGAADAGAPRPRGTRHLGLAKDDVLNVHIVAHTHDDVGWLKTVDEYYYGANNSIQNAGVQYILDSVVQALLLNPQRRFIYVEIAFFERWWAEQTSQMQQLVKDLVTSGRLEFINGGWCMNDEANTHYAAIIAQMSAGHEFLFNNFGVRPTIGWHIDPFGHASTQATLFALMGFDAFFFARIDYQDKANRLNNSELELVWRASRSLGKSAEIFTHILYDGYGPPGGFCFECSADQPIQDDPRLFNLNIQQRADALVTEAKQRAAAYRTNNIMMTFGSDFQFQNANINFKNMDKLIEYINSKSATYGVHIFYSTPSIYIDAVHAYAQANNLKWTVKTDDFFPYADNAHSYWTGYFTSRPALKGYVRSRNNLLHATDKLYSSVKSAFGDDPSIYNADNYAKIYKLLSTFSVAQHHDAVAGTEKQHVAYDYAERLSIGSVDAESLVSTLVTKLLARSSSSSPALSTNVADGRSMASTSAGQGKASPPSFVYCPYLNISYCPVLILLHGVNARAVPVVAYNPLGWSRVEYLRLPVPRPDLEVVDSDGNTIPAQVEPNEDLKGFYTLIFPIALPAMGYSSVVVQPQGFSSGARGRGKSTVFAPRYDLFAGGRGAGSDRFSALSRAGTTFSIENEYLRVTFSNSTGRMASLAQLTDDKINVSVAQDLLWYNGSYGDGQPSGAYIFRPNGTQPFDMTPNGNTPSRVTVTRGNLAQEVLVQWNDWAYETVRLYSGKRHVEVEYTVGPIDISDNLGKEVVTRFDTGLATNKRWYSDSEGGEMQQRILNFRPTWKLNVTEPVAGNYYPMNTAAYIQDTSKKVQFTIVNDRSQGMSSLADGQIEVMLHRRLLHDDWRGVGEPLNETEQIRTTHRVFLDSISTSARDQRPEALLLNNPPILLFGDHYSGKAANWFSTFQATYKALSADLPPNVHLLDFRTLDTGDVLLRLHHIYSVGEDAQYSAPVSVDVSTLFAGLRITAMTEMTLSGNTPLSESHRLQWNTVSSSRDQVVDADVGAFRKPQAVGDFVVQLKPMEIRTFVIRTEQA